MNSFKKYCAHTFVAECDAQHEKGDIITLTTRRGKEIEVEVYNLVYQNDDKYYYSFVRMDGLNHQTRAAKRAAQYAEWQAAAERRSDEWWEKSQEGREFLSLGEPIHAGHYSEKRHRALIDRNHARMRNAVQEDKKAKSYDSKIQYWESTAKEINLSMPESLEYWEAKLEKAQELHQMYKEHPETREHAHSLSYARKAVKDAEKNLNLAQRLWG